MYYNLLIGGAAGQGMDTMAAVLVKLLKKEGFAVLTTHDFMSRVRGGHNFVLIRFGDSPVYSHSMVLDGLIALDDDTVSLHMDELKPDGFILCDEKIETDDARALKIPLREMAKELGNPKVSGSIATGAVLKLFGLSLDGMKEILEKELKEPLIDINLKAYEKGFA